MSEEEIKVMNIIKIYILFCLTMLLAGLVFCECGYTPDCFPPAGVVEPGTRRIPPIPPETVFSAWTPEGQVVGMAFQDWRMVADWGGAPPAWWEPVDWVPETYWWLTGRDYYSYGRMGCRQESNETVTDWVCIAQFWAFYDDDVVTYRMYKDTNCTEWVLTEEHNLTRGTPVMVRKATRRVQPAPRE